MLFGLSGHSAATATARATTTATTATTQCVDKVVNIPVAVTFQVLFLQVVENTVKILLESKGLGHGLDQTSCGRRLHPRQTTRPAIAQDMSKTTGRPCIRRSEAIFQTRTSRGRFHRSGRRDRSASVPSPSKSDGMLATGQKLVAEDGVLSSLYSRFGPVLIKQIPHTMAWMPLSRSHELLSSVILPEESSCGDKDGVNLLLHGGSQPARTAVLRVLFGTRICVRNGRRIKTSRGARESTSNRREGCDGRLVQASPSDASRLTCRYMFLQCTFFFVVGEEDMTLRTLVQHVLPHGTGKHCRSLHC